MDRGRKKPRETKDPGGTLRKHREPAEVVDFPEVEPAALPKPPVWVKGVDARREWTRLVKLLTANHVLTEGDLSALGHLCALHGEIVDDLRRKVRPTGTTRTQLRLFYEEFGLTPASRGKVSYGGIPIGSGNPFDDV